MKMRTFGDSTFDFVLEDDEQGSVSLERQPMEVVSVRTLIWEVRRRLQEFKDAGREVVYYSHNMNLFDLYLASVADRRACAR